MSRGVCQASGGTSRCAHPRYDCCSPPHSFWRPAPYRPARSSASQACRGGGRGGLPLPLPGPGLPGTGRVWAGVFPIMPFGRVHRTFGIIGAVAVGGIILGRMSRRDGVEVTRRTKVVARQGPRPGGRRDLPDQGRRQPGHHHRGTGAADLRHQGRSGPEADGRYRQAGERRPRSTPRQEGKRRKHQPRRASS